MLTNLKKEKRRGAAPTAERLNRARRARTLRHTVPVGQHLGRPSILLNSATTARRARRMGLLLALHAERARRAGILVDVQRIHDQCPGEPRARPRTG
jgi:hypothetical protein